MVPCQLVKHHLTNHLSTSTSIVDPLNRLFDKILFPFHSAPPRPFVFWSTVAFSSTNQHTLVILPPPACHFRSEKIIVLLLVSAHAFFPLVKTSTLATCLRHCTAHRSCFSPDFDVSFSALVSAYVAATTTFSEAHNGNVKESGM